MKVDILGTKYKIKYKDFGKEDQDGYCDPTKKEIVIRKDNFYKAGDFDLLSKRNLRHEIIHAFLAESGLQENWQHSSEFGHDETTVDWIAIQFPKLKKVFKKLDILD